MRDLRSDMAQIHEEISELRALVAQQVFHRVLKLNQEGEEVAVYAVRCKSTLCFTGILYALCVWLLDYGLSWSTLHGSSQNLESNWNTCRCGHMCTCFKCACQLQWNSGLCPICGSPIVDVVRTFPNS
ncbi:hypothetical protein B296_00038758 [Ensete ventricosum]|uniref:RING-type domain-containing protein n=1 Tax=Ensete ventricosum TaxID=4639 RepID=A0A426ZSB4_ENSVE|nr:hypothetical protein B296_00038758 [Ensete ventricosum]